METSLLLACDPTTSWYYFAYPLSWSNNCQVAEVLSDIPFVSLGILVFGVSVLFLVLKRVSLSAVCLFFSALLAFVAAVLDLGQTLADGMAANTIDVANESAIRAREVLLALSVGLRFLFYWSYVAEPPRKARSATCAQSVQGFNLLALECTHGTHSASWIRRGLPGKLLGMALLVAIITITALQIVWRVAPRFHQYSGVYAADAALELLVSFLLLLKLLLNTVTLESPDSILVHTFGECLAPISGLLVNIAIGVGDLLCFAFTESTVGRLLQTFEVYIIVVFVAVTAILRYRDTLRFAASSQSKKCSDDVFTLPEPARGSTFRITPPLVETPRISTVLGTATQNKESSREALRHSVRRSLNHVSSWVFSRVSRNRPRYEDEEVKLWNASEIKVHSPYAGNIDTEPRTSVVPQMTQEPAEWANLLRDASAKHMKIISALDAQSAKAQSMEGPIPEHTIPLQARTSSVFPTSFVPPSISSGAKHAASMTEPPEAPVHGLGRTQSLASAPDSRTSIDELLRQQSQLDRSIEALKLIYARTSTNSSSSNLVLGPGNVKLTRSPSTGQRTVSSDVSLSNFPVPPWLATPVPTLPSPRPSPVKRIREDRRARLTVARPNPVQDISKTSASLVDIPSSLRSNGTLHSSLSGSPPAEAEKSSRSDSGGTRYNVTSFIDDLSTPGEPRWGSPEKSWSPRESAIQTSSVMKRLPSHMLPVPLRSRELPAVPKLSPPARSSRLSQGDVADQPADVMQYRINDQTSRCWTIALSPPTPVTDKGTSIPLTRPQPAPEIGSSVTLSAEGVDRVQRMFVRPRPPPLVIQPYIQHHPSTPQVQVVADD